MFNVTVILLFNIKHMIKLPQCFNMSFEFNPTSFHTLPLHVVLGKVPIIVIKNIIMENNVI